MLLEPKKATLDAEGGQILHFNPAVQEGRLLNFAVNRMLLQEGVILLKLNALSCILLILDAVIA